MDAQFVLGYLKQIPAFKGLDLQGEEELLRLVPHVNERHFEAGHKILDQRHPPDRTVFILEGEVELYEAEDNGSEGRSLGTQTPGFVMGRQGLQPGDYDKFIATAQTEVRALVLPFRDLVRAYDRSEYLKRTIPGPLKPSQLVPTLREIRLFEDFTGRQGNVDLHRIAGIVHDQVYNNGEWLFRQGEISDRLYYILEGRIELTQVDRNGLITQVDTLKPGEIAGETGLLVGDFHDVIATADGYARALYIPSEDFRAMMADHPHIRRRLNVTPGVDKRRRMREFDWLRDDEWVVETVQRHWVRLSRQIGAPTFILLLLLPVLYAAFAATGWFYDFLTVLLLAPVAILAGIIVWQYLNWRDDYFVITTQRVVHIERTWPFSAETEETLLDNVEDIYEMRPSLTANLMNFGNLVLQTAGETVEIDMNYTPKPAHIREVIAEQIERSQARDLLRTQGKIRDLLARRLEITEAEEEEPEPSTGEREKPSLMVGVVRSIWEYLFPPSWLEAEQGETIIWRRYWLPGFVQYLLAFVPLAVITIGGGLLLISLDVEQNLWVWIAVWLGLEALSIAVLMWFIEDWRNDYFQLTRSHIILVEQRPLLLQESRRQARLDRIQNLGFEVPNIPARLFDYGHVFFETAGEEGFFRLEWVHHPNDVQATISNRQYQYNQRQQDIAAARRQQELLSWFSTYDDLKQEAQT
jgi:CRP-like cAMP-binding protein